jgi:flavin reductase (DIM6/NTAB) family NADH-FMN oxidoreductase RutF
MMLSSAIHRLQQTPPHPPAAEATEKTFREAMRQVAGGVSVVTVGAHEERTGLTATSVTSLCADPPTLLVCINRESSSYQALTRFGFFAVNVLAADQREVAERFGGGSGLTGSQRYQGDRWLALPSGVRRLADAAAVFECEVDEPIERHTHAIVIGRVRHVLVGAGSGALVRWRGAYDQVGWSTDEISRAIGLSPSEGK